jgi:hypothetical protein
VVSFDFGAAPLIASTLRAVILTVGTWSTIYLVLTVARAALALACLALFEEDDGVHERGNLMPATVAAG